jgi:hypothetical protein
MHFADVLATETAAYHLMQIAPEELSPTARATLFGCGRVIARQMRTGKVNRSPTSGLFRYEAIGQRTRD